MSKSPAFLENSLIVAAHPDDELLWFGSILKKVDRVIIVYEDYWPDPKIGPARIEALANFPRKNVSSLKIAEAATYGCANWPNPTLSQYGITLGPQAELRDAKQAIKRRMGRGSDNAHRIRATYRANFDRIYKALKDQLKPDMNVFTHNPWGEYGHEDHLQVFRVLDKLRREIGFKLWMSNYCTERALPLAMTYFDNEDREMIQLPVDTKFADQVADVYRAANCWTWSNSWNWFETETFMEAPLRQSNVSGLTHLFPLNFFNIAPIDGATGADILSD